MRSDAFSIGAFVAGAVVLCLYFAPDLLGPTRRWLAESVAPEPERAILVVIVGTPGNVEVMRKTVGRERILVDAPNSFALDEGRVIAASLEEAGESVTAAGWVDPPLEIVAELRRRPEVLRAPDAPASAGEARAGGPGPMLTQAEALQLLESIR